MGYFFISEVENAVRENPPVRPKMHTPFPQVQERGLRFDSPGLWRPGPYGRAASIRKNAFVSWLVRVRRQLPVAAPLRSHCSGGKAMLVEL